jgi:phospholipase/lecithinase/hemolysin
MWPEYLSTNLGLAYVAANNLAVCGADSIDIRDQISNFIPPLKPQLSLYCLWVHNPYEGGVSFLVHAITNRIAGDQLIQTTVSINSNSVNRLYSKGARTILIEFDPDWSKDFADIAQWAQYSALLPHYGEFQARYNAAFTNAMSLYSHARPDLRILYVDTFTEINNVLSNPARYGFTVYNIDALDDPALADKSLNGPGADYVYWDAATHPTPKLHKLIADWHFKSLSDSIQETVDVTVGDRSATLRMNHLQIGRDYTLQASSDLNHWQDLRTFTASAGTNQWTAASGAVTSAFYRLKWQP